MTMLQPSTKMKLPLLGIFLAVIISQASAQEYSGDKKIFCYYSSFAQGRTGAGKFLPHNIDPHLCSHIIFAFGKISGGSNLEASNWNDLSTSYQDGLYAKTTALKTINPKLKVLLAFGGWAAGSDPFIPMMNSDSVRAQFVQNAITFLRENNFDGFDMDWEFPGTRGSKPEDKYTFTKLMSELQTAFHEESRRTGRDKLLLTLAAAGGTFFIDKAYEPTKLARIVDFLLLMSYNYHGSWNDYTGHHSGLYPRADEKGGEREWNTAWTIDYWVNKAGADKQKVIVGIPTYGMGFTLANSNDHGVRAKTAGGSRKGPYTGEQGIMSYYELCEKLRNGWRSVWIEDQKVPYVYHGDQWIGYENKDSVQHKAHYIKEYGLGGAFIWSVEMDDFQGTCGEGKYPLLSTISEVLRSPQPSYSATTNQAFSNAVQSGSYKPRSPSSIYTPAVFGRQQRQPNLAPVISKRQVTEPPRGRPQAKQAQSYSSTKQQQPYPVAAPRSPYPSQMQASYPPQRQPSYPPQRKPSYQSSTPRQMSYPAPPPPPQRNPSSYPAPSQRKPSFPAPARKPASYSPPAQRQPSYPAPVQRRPSYPSPPAAIKPSYQAKPASPAKPSYSTTSQKQPTSSEDNDLSLAIAAQQMSRYVPNPMSSNVYDEYRKMEYAKLQAQKRQLAASIPVNHFKAAAPAKVSATTASTSYPPPSQKYQAPTSYKNPQSEGENNRKLAQLYSSQKKRQQSYPPQAAPAPMYQPPKPKAPSPPAKYPGYQKPPSSYQRPQAPSKYQSPATNNNQSKYPQGPPSKYQQQSSPPANRYPPPPPPPPPSSQRYPAPAPPSRTRYPVPPPQQSRYQPPAPQNSQYPPPPPQQYPSSYGNTRPHAKQSPSSQNEEQTLIQRNFDLLLDQMAALNPDIADTMKEQYPSGHQNNGISQQPDTMNYYGDMVNQVNKMNPDLGSSLSQYRSADNGIQASYKVTRSYAPVGPAAKQAPSYSNNPEYNQIEEGGSDLLPSNQEFEYFYPDTGLDVSDYLKKYSEMNNDTLNEQLRQLELEDKMIRMQAAMQQEVQSHASSHPSSPSHTLPATLTPKEGYHVLDDDASPFGMYLDEVKERQERAMLQAHEMLRSQIALGQPLNVPATVLVQLPDDKRERIMYLMSSINTKTDESDQIPAAEESMYYDDDEEFEENAYNTLENNYETEQPAQSIANSYEPDTTQKYYKESPAESDSQYDYDYQQSHTVDAWDGQNVEQNQDYSQDYEYETDDAQGEDYSNYDTTDQKNTQESSTSKPDYYDSEYYPSESDQNEDFDYYDQYTDDKSFDKTQNVKKNEAQLVGYQNINNDYEADSYLKKNTEKNVPETTNEDYEQYTDYDQSYDSAKDWQGQDYSDSEPSSSATGQQEQESNSLDYNTPKGQGKYTSQYKQNNVNEYGSSKTPQNSQVNNLRQQNNNQEIENEEETDEEHDVIEYWKPSSEDLKTIERPYYKYSNVYEKMLGFQNLDEVNEMLEKPSLNQVEKTPEVEKITTDKIVAPSENAERSTAEQRLERRKEARRKYLVSLHDPEPERYIIYNNKFITENQYYRLLNATNGDASPSVESTTLPEDPNIVADGLAQRLVGGKQAPSISSMATTSSPTAEPTTTIFVPDVYSVYEKTIKPEDREKNEKVDTSTKTEDAEYQYNPYDYSDYYEDMDVPDSETEDSNEQEAFNPYEKELSGGDDEGDSDAGLNLFPVWGANPLKYEDTADAGKSGMLFAKDYQKSLPEDEAMDMYVSPEESQPNSELGQLVTESDNTDAELTKSTMKPLSQAYDYDYNIPQSSQKTNNKNKYVDFNYYDYGNDVNYNYAYGDYMNLDEKKNGIVQNFNSKGLNNNEDSKKVKTSKLSARKHQKSGDEGLDIVLHPQHKTQHVKQNKVDKRPIYNTHEMYGYSKGRINKVHTPLEKDYYYNYDTINSFDPMYEDFQEQYSKENEIPKQAAVSKLETTFIDPLYEDYLRQFYQHNETLIKMLDERNSNKTNSTVAEPKVESTSLPPIPAQDRLSSDLDLQVKNRNGVRLTDEERNSGSGLNPINTKADSMDAPIGYLPRGAQERELFTTPSPYNTEKNEGSSYEEYYYDGEDAYSTLQSQREDVRKALQKASVKSPQQAYEEAIRQMSSVDPQVASAWKFQSDTICKFAGMYRDAEYCDGYYMCIKHNATMYTFQMQCPDGLAYLDGQFMCGIDWECKITDKKQDRSAQIIR